MRPPLWPHDESAVLTPAGTVAAGGRAGREGTREAVEALFNGTL